MAWYDSVGEVLGDAVNLYGQVESIKLQTELARAQASAEAAALPSRPQNIEATAQNRLAMQRTQSFNNIVMMGALLVGGFALYKIVK